MAAVLVVEDEESIRRFVRIALEYRGHRVAEASDAATARAYLRTTDEPLVIVADQHTLLSTGGVVAQDAELIARHACLLMTAQAELLSPEGRRRLAELAVPVVTKPFRLCDLLDHVDAAAGRLACSPRAAGLPVAD